MEPTYEILMNRFHLRPCHGNSSKIRHDQPAKARHFAKLISYNFIEAHFYGYNIYFKRFYSSDSLEPEKRFDKGILYKIMQNEEILEFLGHVNCFRIIDEIVQAFKPYICFEKNFVKQLIESISLQITDFLEFILEEMVPKYQYKRGDPEFNVEAFAEFEYPTFVLVEDTLPMSVIAAFREIELLKVIVRRYAKIWPVSSTEIIIKESLKYLRRSPDYFRQVLDLMVRHTPEYFLLSAHMHQYQPPIGQWNFCALMANMAPILRALLLVDSDYVRNRYLQEYHNRIRTALKTSTHIDEDALKVLNAFMQDSKFALDSSAGMFEKKKEILENILMKFFGINTTDYLKAARLCLKNNYLALYEVILKYVAKDVFGDEQHKDLLQFLIHSDKINTSDAPLAASISMAYFKFEDFTDVLKNLKQTIKFDFTGYHDKSVRERIFKKQRMRFNWIQEIRKYLASCPVVETQKICVPEEFEPVNWLPPVYLSTFTENDPENYMKLYYYAQVVLCKRFGIPYFNASVFEEYMQEGATWNESIDYINFVIEMMASRLGYKNVKLFKFQRFIEEVNEEEIEVNEKKEGKEIKL